MCKDIIGYGIIGSIVVGLFFLLNGVLTYETIVYPEYATAATTTAVTVSANVAAIISCSTNTGSTVFGTLTNASVFTASPNASTTMSCANSAAGCTLYVKDAGGGGNPGLWNSTSSALIESPNATFSATSTLTAGTEGYGIQATTTAAGSGATLAIAAKFNQTGNTVGGLTLTNGTLASANATSSNREVVVAHKAAIANNTPAGTYNDTITYECAAN
jgi:hypothetical protein